MCGSCRAPCRPSARASTWTATCRRASGWPPSGPPRRLKRPVPPGGSRGATAPRQASSTWPPRSKAQISSWSAPADTRSPIACCWGRSPPGCYTTRADRCWSSAELLWTPRPSADDQDRAVGQIDNLVGHAAEQEGVQVAAATGAEDDHAPLVVPGGCDDEPRHMPCQGTDQLDLGRHAGQLELLAVAAGGLALSRSWSSSTVTPPRIGMTSMTCSTTTLLPPSWPAGGRTRRPARRAAS